MTKKEEAIIERKNKESFKQFYHLDYLGHPILRNDRIVYLHYNLKNSNITSAQFVRRRVVKLTQKYVIDNTGHKCVPERIINISYYED